MSPPKSPGSSRRSKRHELPARRPGGQWAIRIRKGGRSRIKLVCAKSKHEAEQIRATLQAKIDRAGLREAEATGGTRLADIVDAWAKRRAELGVRTARTERGHLVNHIVPRLGALPLSEIRVKHVVELIDDLRAEQKASRTIRNIHNTGRCLWKYLVKREVVLTNPWTAAADSLPKIKDSDPDWRAEAVFERWEVELLISAPEIPPDRRMMNALLFLAGMRIGEGAGLRFRHYDPTDQPLGRLTMAHSYDGPSKTDRLRFTPVHPTLAAMLAEWRLHWWPKLFGRLPRPDDFVVPGPPGPMWDGDLYYKRFHDDLRTLGLRVQAGTKNKTRGTQCGRATFLSIGVDDGADLDILERATHTGQKGSTAQRHYLRKVFPKVCREVVKLNIRRPATALPMVASAEGGTGDDCSQDCSQSTFLDDSEEFAAMEDSETPMIFDHEQPLSSTADASTPSSGTRFLHCFRGYVQLGRILVGRRPSGRSRRRGKTDLELGDLLQSAGECVRR